MVLAENYSSILVVSLAGFGVVIAIRPVRNVLDDMGKGSPIRKVKKMQQQLVADMDRVDLALFLGTERMLEEARRATPEFRAMKKDLKVKSRRRRLTVLKWRLLAIVGK